MPLPAPLTESCVGRLRCPGRPPEPGDLCNLPCQDVFGYRKLHHPGVYQLDNHSSLPQGDRFLVQNPSLRAPCPKSVPPWPFCWAFNPERHSCLQGAVLWEINIALLAQKLQAILTYIYFFSLTDCNFSFLGEAFCGNGLARRGLANSC